MFVEKTAYEKQEPLFFDKYWLNEIIFHRR